MSTRNRSWEVKAASAERWHVYHLQESIVWKSGNLRLLEPSRLLQAYNWTAYFTSLNEAVLHTIHTEAANIQADYVSINSMIMECMESNWMAQTEEQMGRNSFWNHFGYKWNALNRFQGFKKVIPCVVTLEFRASTG